MARRQEREEIAYVLARAANLLLRLLTRAARYDVEMFQKVEVLTGLRMEKFECEADAALLLLERTTEAQQMATMQVQPDVCISLHVCGGA